MKLSDYIVSYLESIGVQDVFLLSGGGCMHLVESLSRSTKIKSHHFLHEQSAAVACDAYSQITGKLGVCVVTSGPGATNAITGLVASYIDSTPILFLSGQCKTPDLSFGTVRQKGCQEVDIISIVEKYTKYSKQVEDITRIKSYLNRAVECATKGRKGTAWLDIPLDIQCREIDEASLPSICATYAIPLWGDYATIIELYKQAKKPCILIGHGVRASEAIDEARELIELLEIPTLFTWRMADMLDHLHYLNFGRGGLITSKRAKKIEDNCDLVIAIGARLDLMQVAWDYKTFCPNAKKIVVDIDERELEKLPDDYYKVNSDAKYFLRGLLDVIR